MTTSVSLVTPHHPDSPDHRPPPPPTRPRSSATLTPVPDLAWGQDAELSAFETLLWRADTDQSLRSPLLALEELDTVPDWDRFLAVHARLVDQVPRLRERVVEAPLDLATPRWSADPHFDLRFHVWRSRLPAGAGWPELLDRAARLAMAPVDRARPPWEAVLLEGLPNGRAAYLLKMHHALTDGLGAAQLLEALHRRHPEPEFDVSAVSTFPTRRAARAGGAEAKSDPATRPLDVLAHQVRRDVAALPALLRAACSGAVDVLTHPKSSLRSVARYGSSLRRTLGPLTAEPSPLLAERGVAWRFTALDVPLPGLRAAARAGGGTVHDAYLAALLGGYRRYHAALGRPVDSLPVGIPISVRRPGDPAGGNRILAIRICAPVAIADPKARIRRVRELILAARGEPALHALGLMFPTLARLPAALSTQLVGSVTRGNDLQASFVPGVRTARYLAGARIERIYPFAPRPGCPAMITLVTHRDLACVGVNFDPAAFGRTELFTRCLLDGFAEVLRLAPNAAAPSARG